MKKIERVGFVIKPHAPDVDKILAKLIQHLEKKKMECFLENEAAQKLKKGQRNN
jgi:NAD+ kinase